MRRQKGLLGLVAGLAGALSIGVLAPSSALAHPCSTTYSAKTATFLSANNVGFAGGLPTLSDDEDCAVVNDDGTARVRQALGATAADPVGDATASFTYTPNLRPLGYSARNLPLNSSLNGINSDLAFKDDLVIQGHWSGFRIIDVADPANPTQLVNYEACAHPSGQGDVVVHGDLLVWTADAPANATHTCGGQLVGQGFEGIHLFDISNPSNPQYIRKLRMASSGNEAGAPSGCGAHTATAVPDTARDALYLYVGGSSGSCTGIDIVKIKISDPTQATFIRRASAGRQCHDNNVILGDVNLAMCAGGNGFSVFKFDPALDPTAPGGIEQPTLLYSKSMGVSTAHSGSFSYDGKVLIFGHEPGGGSAAQCQASSSVLNRSLFFMDPLTGNQIGVLVHPRPQTNRENCTWHNFNVIPTYKGNIAVSGSYQAGISVIDFTNPAAPQEMAYADPAQLNPNQIILGGDWGTYIHNGVLYESDIRRGLITWDLLDENADRARTFSTANPQTQTISYEQDYEGPEITAPASVGYKVGSTATPEFDCTDAGAGVESCTATPLDTSSVGTKTFTVTATDKAGNVSTKDVEYLVNSADFPGSAGGEVPATLSLTLGTAPSFGSFVPGVANTYTASTTANVISSAGDATLSVADNGPNAGHLVNGAFALPQPLGGLGVVKTYDGPVSNDAASVTFTQAIGANDALRTGSYSKALTFTLSTTNP